MRRCWRGLVSVRASRAWRTTRVDGRTLNRYRHQAKGSGGQPGGEGKGWRPARGGGAPLPAISWLAAAARSAVQCAVCSPAAGAVFLAPLPLVASAASAGNDARSSDPCYGASRAASTETRPAETGPAPVDSSRRHVSDSCIQQLC